MRFNLSFVYATIKEFFPTFSGHAYQFLSLLFDVRAKPGICTLKLKGTGLYK